MKPQNLGLIASTSVLLLGCQKVYGPALYLIEPEDACLPAFASRDCAPSHGSPYVILDKDAKTIPLVAGVPKVTDYLGRVLPDGDSSGAPGLPCGGTTTLAFPLQSAVETVRDEETGDVRMDVENDFFQTRKISANAKINIVEALKAVPHVPQNIGELLRADLEIAYDQLDTVSVKAVGQFQQWQLQSEELDMLNIGDFSTVTDPARLAALQACRAMVVPGAGIAPRARMYQALTGFYVSSLKADSTSVQSITANLAAKVKATAPQADLGAIQASLNVTSTEAIRTSVSPMFVVVAVSFWKPIYIPD